jgi:hypothetical protein
MQSKTIVTKTFNLEAIRTSREIPHSIQSSPYHTRHYKDLQSWKPFARVTRFPTPSNPRISHASLFPKAFLGPHKTNQPTATPIRISNPSETDPYQGQGPRVDSPLAASPTTSLLIRPGLRCTVCLSIYIWSTYNYSTNK